LEDLIHQMEATLLALNFVSAGDTVLILGGVPLRKARTTSFLDIHTIGELGENPIF
jgi:pyruvate kinase